MGLNPAFSAVNLENNNMKNHFDRHPIRKISKKIYFKKGKKIISGNPKAFFKKNHIHCVIQVLPTDFNMIKKTMIKYTHFNIQYTVHKTGKYYFIIKIYKRGYYNGKIYRTSILDGNNFILAKCISAKNYVNYKDLKKNIFRNSIDTIKNVRNLKKAIIRRYKKTLSHLSDKEKLSLGVGITQLKIIKRL